jgi:adenosylmethionine-8-amino-7-oxononanoate aminotransferase
VPAITLANRLIGLAYDNMQGVFFTSGGAESNESAFKTARFYWKAVGKPGKVKVISRQQAYHGVTLQAMSATGMGAYWKMFEPRVPGFVHIPTCYPYRQVDQKPGESAGQTAARLLEEAILREGAETVAAFIAEPIQGAGGVIVPPPNYFAEIRRICDAHDVLFIADEVITGFGRTGRWFGLERHGVEPDIVQFAKGITSGYIPLGGIGVSDKVREVMNAVPPGKRWMHAHTYSGHATACAVAAENIAIIEREELVARAAASGARLLDGLKTFLDADNVGHVRGQGLIAAVEVVADKATKQLFPAELGLAGRLTEAMLQRGLCTRVALDCICLAPPLVITDDEIARTVAIVGDSLAAVTADVRQLA